MTKKGWIESHSGEFKGMFAPVFLDSNSFLHPAAEGERIAKLLWQNTVNYRHRVDLEILTKYMIGRVIYACESCLNEGDPIPDYDIPRFEELILLFKTLLENYHE